MPRDPNQEVDAGGWDDQPAVSSDFFQGDISKGLEKMRLRLLDLTARNRLLNFKHTKKSSLRVVDELPDQLFSELLDGKSFRFKPVPRPRLIQQQPNAGPSLAPTAKEYAERLGISTDFELPEEAADNRHADREIQTLHFPEELEGVLRSISSAARLAIEETGSNMLYLVAGFLEWYESPDSLQPRMAPLLLLPVFLTKESPASQGSTYRYSIQHTGEELLTNVSLQERLRTDFNIELPEVEEGEGPESYIARLRGILGNDGRWHLHRNVTLTLLSFGKILMYRDLDPKTWPAAASIADHARIREFFEGIQCEDMGFAAEYQLDSPEMGGRVPLLVDDADSSQHSALVDALEGKNIVVEGPPGTGKSQTITNLIAAAMVKGKRVLFVSEKLAALEVVRHRLDKVGLGAFCLELHSHKTQKRALLDDLENRIKQRGTFTAPALLESKLSAVAADRDLLTRYVELINQKFGSVDQSLHEVIWSAKRHKNKLEFDPALIEKVRLNEARKLDAKGFADYRQLATQFAAHLHQVLEGRGAVAEHPWFGVSNTALTFLDIEGILGDLRSLVQASGRLEELIDHANAMVGARWMPDTLEGLRGLCATIDSLPADAARIIPNLLPRLRDPHWRRRVHEFIELVRKHQQLRQDIESIAGTVPRLPESAIQEAVGLIDTGRNVAPGASTVADFAAAAEAARLAKAGLNEAAAALERLSEALRFQIPQTLDGVKLGERLVAAARDCPLEGLKFRGQGTEVLGSLEMARRGLAEAEVVRAKREALARSFDLSTVPELSELRKHFTAAATAKWWSVILPSYRRARRAYLATLLVPVTPQAQDMARDFRALIALTDDIKAFERNADYQSFQATGLYGVDAQWKDLVSLLEWRDALSDSFAGFGGVGRDAFQVVWAASPADVRAARATAGERDFSGTFASIAGLVEVAEQFVSRVGATEYQPLDVIDKEVVHRT